eukprot:10327-Heterococcus_DN1.PRE.2
MDMQPVYLDDYDDVISQGSPPTLSLCPQAKLASMRNRVQHQQQSENAQDEPGLPVAEASESWCHQSTVSTSASASPYKQQSKPSLPSSAQLCYT